MDVHVRRVGSISSELTDEDVHHTLLRQVLGQSLRLTLAAICRRFFVFSRPNITVIASRPQPLREKR
jgi:hypothetical protein